MTNEIMRAAAERALRYMESVGQADMYPEEWQIALDLRAALASEQPQNVEGPESLAPQPAPGLAFDARGVLVPAEQPRPEAPSRWIACSERMPEDGVDVLVFERGSNPLISWECVPFIAWHSVEGGGWDDGEWGERPKPTHWMPLPAAPGDDRALPAAAPTDARDAARYRWLRDAPFTHWEIVHWTGRCWDTIRADQLDAAVDAALAVREGR